MSGEKPDDPKREILKAADTLQDLSNDPEEHAEAHARAARRVLEEQERQRQEEEKKRKADAERALGWRARLLRHIQTFGQTLVRPLAAIGAFFTIHMPRTSARAASAVAFLERSFLAYVWPVIVAISTTNDESGSRRLTLVGYVLLATAGFMVAWPFFKIYYVLGTTRTFHDAHITFKQIIDQDRYLVFADYTDELGNKENMAFNVTDSWVYWNWTPDLTFAQVPVVGTCDFKTYGWYVRVPRFVPLIGRTLLVEPVVIDAKCKASDIPSQ